MDWPTCPPCKGIVPAISQALAREVAGRIASDPALRQEAIVRSVAWLTERHAGVQLYEGIVGRAYSNDEKKEVAYDQGALEFTSCPFVRTVPDDGQSIPQCALRGVHAQFNWEQERGRAPYGWLPALLLRELDPVTYRLLASRRDIADAKIALMTRVREFPARGRVVLAST